jgi:hypothetical protein
VSASVSGLSVVAFDTPNRIGYNCQTTSLSGSSLGPTGPLSTTTWTGVLSLTPAFTRCSIAGTPVVISGVSGGTFDATSYSSGTTTGRLHGLSWTATYVTCPLSIAIDAPATSNGTSLTLGLTQSSTVSWPNTAACRGVTGASAGGTAGATFRAGTISPLVFTYAPTAPLIFY